MKANLIFISLFLYLSNIQSQNFCGYWVGYGYQCLNKQDQIFDVPYELIYIFQNGSNSIDAIKIIGDDCVTSGQTTWQGIYDTTSKKIIKARIQYGFPNNPNQGFVDGNISIISKDSLSLVVPFSGSTRFKRLSCEQAKKLGANLQDLRYKCDCNNIEPCKIELPNAFTPNNDGLNDTFLPTTVCQFKTYDMKIFSRLGNVVFQTQELQVGWDGTFKNSDLASDVYVWVINAITLNDKPIKLSGEVVLLR